ncbi:MAG: hypothetical protein WAU86_13385 [Oricola sp.]
MAVRFALGLGLLLSWQATAMAQSRHYFLDPDNDDYKRYKGALSKFPDLQACKGAGFLKDGRSFYDLHSVFGTREELELCHYWLFAGAPDSKQAIVDYFGRIEGILIAMPFSALPGRTYVEARWDPSAYGVPFGGFTRRKMAEKLSYAASITVMFQGSRTIRVDMAFASK